MGSEMVVVRNPENIDLWQKRIRECQNSGMTVMNWCSENGISNKTYYYWHRKLTKLQEMQSETASSVFFEVNQSKYRCSEVAATLRTGMLQADIYTGADERIILAICRALKTC